MKRDEELYFWEPYAENHLETLTGGVVIRAEWMRQLIDEATQQLREENERLQGTPLAVSHAELRKENQRLHRDAVHFAQEMEKEMEKEMDKVQALREELEQASRHNQAISEDALEDKKELKRIRYQLVAMVKVLTFYADEATYDTDHLDKHGYIIIDRDGGEQARTILALYATINEGETGKHEIDSDQPWIYSEKGICNCMECRKRRWEDKTICSACGHPLSNVCACDDF